jgi:hypothetical protein
MTYNNKFWEELIAYCSLIHIKRFQQFIIASGTSLCSCYLATLGGHTDRPTDTRQKMLPLLLMFIAAGRCLLSRCLAMKEGIHIQTHGLMGGI